MKTRKPRAAAVADHPAASAAAAGSRRHAGRDSRRTRRSAGRAVAGWGTDFHAAQRRPAVSPDGRADAGRRADARGRRDDSLLQQPVRRAHRVAAGAHHRTARGAVPGVRGPLAAADAAERGRVQGRMPAAHGVRRLESRAAVVNVAPNRRRPDRRGGRHRRDARADRAGSSRIEPAEGRIPGDALARAAHARST